MASINLNNYLFKCVGCGNCCYKAVVKSEFNPLYNTYFYDYRGYLSLDPKTSTTIHYLEKPVIESGIKKRYNLNPKFIPFRVLFLRDFPVGFIYDYQLGVKKGKYCMFYDIKKRNCKIYLLRPVVCKSYPLVVTPFVDHMPTIHLNCTAIENELKKSIPNIKNINKVAFTNSVKSMLSIFSKEYESFKKIIYWNKRIPILFNVMKPLFLGLNLITPEKVSNYDLRDMNEFFQWAKSSLNKSDYGNRMIEFKKRTQVLKNSMKL